MSTEVDQELLKSVVLKLLDRAGHNPLLTARKLRAKAEEKMFGKDNFAGKLKGQRAQIKDYIMLWDEMEKERELSILKLLLRISKVGAAPQAVLKGLSDISLRSERITEFRKRLRDAGYEFSDVPTEEEILAIEKKALLKKDMDGIDSATVIEEPRKRKTDADAADAVKALPTPKKIKEEGGSKPEVKEGHKETSKESHKESHKESQKEKEAGASSSKVVEAKSPPKPVAKKVVVYTKDGDDDEF